MNYAHLVGCTALLALPFMLVARPAGGHSRQFRATVSVLVNAILATFLMLWLVDRQVAHSLAVHAGVVVMTALTWVQYRPPQAMT